MVADAELRSLGLRMRSYPAGGGLCEVIRSGGPAIQGYSYAAAPAGLMAGVRSGLIESSLGLPRPARLIESGLDLSRPARAYRPMSTRNNAGSTMARFRATPQCRCGPVTRPVAPTVPITWPRSTRSPTSTRIVSR